MCVIVCVLFIFNYTAVKGNNSRTFDEITLDRNVFVKFFCNFKTRPVKTCHKITVGCSWLFL